MVYKYKDEELCPAYLNFSSVAKIPTLNDYHLSPERFCSLVAELRKGRVGILPGFISPYRIRR
ncbi:hypothetical protein SFC43_10065 [Bacteroides sp. CR5/BHMF/2]|nr:hypothetical protein [Bacteroides sp. CR5/BHMF/2]